MLRLIDHPDCNPACRACHYKVLDYPAQLDKKQRWAERCLQPWLDVLAPIIAAPAEDRLAYRTKSWLKSEFDRSPDGTVQLSFGMYRAIQIDGEWEKEFINWDRCPLHAEAIREVIARVKTRLLMEAPDCTENSLVGIWIGSPHIVFVAKDDTLEAFREIDWRELLVAPFKHVWFHRNVQVGRKIFGHEAIHLLAGSPPESAHPIRAFRQVARGLLAQARERAREALLRGNPALVLDLYCGTGEISNLIPAETGWIGIELTQEAAEFAQTHRSGQSTLHTSFVGTVEHRLRDPRVQALISEPYALYINPPRSGLSPEAQAQVIDLLRRKRPTSLVYLSCSASSLARDLEGFSAEGYRVESLQPYDFFPQTEHFETLAILTRSTDTLRASLN